MPQTALITGASSGLGLELAKLFAADHHDVVLVARRRERLETLARELTETHGIVAHVIAADLAERESVSAVLAELASKNIAVDFLVNNAGFGQNGPFVQHELDRQLEMIELNIAAVLHLTHSLLPAMLERGRGRILNVGSVAGFQPGPYMATYYATKAFLNSFSQALAHELRDTPVTVTVSCPGTTRTEFAEVAGHHRSPRRRKHAADAGSVAREAYAAMNAGQPIVVHGLVNRFTAAAVRVAPRAAVLEVVTRINAGSSK